VYIADPEGTLIESESTIEINEEMSAALVVEIFNRASEIIEKLSADKVDIIAVEGKNLGFSFQEQRTSYWASSQI